MIINRRSFISGTGSTVLVPHSGFLKKSAFAVAPQNILKSDVSFVCSLKQYTRKQTIHNVLEPFRSYLTEAIQNRKLVIIPEGTNGNEITTIPHVDALKGLIEFIRSISNHEIIICISSCNKDETDIFRTSEYYHLSSEYKNVSLASIDQTDCIFTTSGIDVWKNDLSSTFPFDITSPVPDSAYFIFSLTSLNRVTGTVFSGGCRNLILGASGISGEPFLPAQNGWRTTGNSDGLHMLSYMLFQLGNQLLPAGAPVFSVFDACENASDSLTDVKRCCAVAGSDPLAVDCLAARLSKVSDSRPDDANKNTFGCLNTHALQWLSNAGIGNYGIDNINFIHGSLEKLEAYIHSSADYENCALYETPVNKYDNFFSELNPCNKHNSLRDLLALDPKPFLFPQEREVSWRHRLPVSFALPVSFQIAISIHDSEGREVRLLGNEYLSPGKYTTDWDRRDKHGNIVLSGQYTVRLTFDDNRCVSDRFSLI